VLVGGLNPFYLSLLRGVEDVAAEQGTLVLVTDTRDSPTTGRAMIRRLIARGVDGIVAVSVGGIGTNAGAPPIVYVDQPDRNRPRPSLRRPRRPGMPPRATSANTATSGSGS